MKLLLTSAGITNKSLARALKQLVGGEMRFAFIPTAAHHSVGDKGWLIKNYAECQKLGSVDIVDISAVGKDVWLPRLKAADVIVVGGGRGILHLLKWMKKSGLEKMLPGLLRSRVYVGISSGSMIAQRRISPTPASCIPRISSRHPKAWGTWISA